MAGISALRKIQLGKENPAGTKVAASAKLLGTLTMEEVFSFYRPEEERGSLAPQHRTEIAGEEVNLRFEGALTYEQILYLLNMAVKQKTTADGAGPPYTWTFEPSLAAANTPQSFTIEYGDDVAEHEVEYAVAREVRIRGALNEPLRMEADIFARNLAASSFTSLGDPTVPEIALMNKTLLYIDAIGGTIGTTPKAATLLDFNFSYRDFVPRLHGGSTNYFDSVGEPKIWCRLEMTLDFNAGAVTERAFYAAGTRRLFALKSTGSSSRSLQINLAGVYTSWGTLVDRDGADTVAVVIEGEYDATWVKLVQVIVVNTVGTLT